MMLFAFCPPGGRPASDIQVATARGVPAILVQSAAQPALVAARSK